MIKRIRKFLLTGLLISGISAICAVDARGQQADTDSLLNATLAGDSLLLDVLMLDSLTVLDLIDSLLKMDLRFSILSGRIGYTSNIINAGRDFGFEQYGLNGGMAYYHKSGLFGDVTGYWNSDSEPNYNLTVLSAGYMNNLIPAWNYILSYDYYWYNKAEGFDYPLSHAANLNTYYDLKFISPGIDYTFFFGRETAHRIRPVLYATLRIKKAWFLDEISFFPGASMLFGNQNIINLNENYQTLRSLIRQIGSRKFLLLYRNNPELIESLTMEESVENVFGFMNYSFSIPVSFKAGNFNISTGYYLNFPVALPGENIDTSAKGYFNFMLLYTIAFSKI